MTSELATRLQASLGSSYTIERELGGGGMARVFVVFDNRLDRRVVVKVLSPELAAAISAERFEREIRVAAQLQDPRIVPVLSAGDTDGLPHYTMPFVDGESLRARMQRGRVPVHEAISILRDVALALKYAHEHGIVHRDIKPENILLSNNTAVVTDFGIAKALATTTNHGALATLTQQGLALGTPAYMAPEQALGDGTVDQRSDIYAWGVVAWELLAGEHPFAGRVNSSAMMSAHIGTVPSAIATRSEKLPRALAAIVDASLRKDPDERPRDASALLSAMDGDLQSTAARHRSAPDWRTVTVLMAVVAVAALLVGGYVLTRKRTSAAAAVTSIAVMPFTSAGDTANRYLAQGISDELVTTLARLPGLRVIARRASSAIDERDAQSVGRALNADAILEGTVQRSGDQLRINARVTTTRNDSVMWTARYDRGASDVFKLQDDIATSIAVSLRGAFSDERAYFPDGTPRGTRSPEAYDLYLRGRYAWSRRGERGLRTAIQYYERALRADPMFAKAYAGLAMSWGVLPIFTTSVRVDSALQLAQDNGARALALDSTLADAHLAMANALKMRWRWSDAESHFAAAVALAPDDATAHHWYGVYLFATGHPQASVEQLGRARSLDPFASSVATDGALAFLAERRYDDARREIERAMALDSTRNDAWFSQGIIQLAQGHADSARTSFDRARQLGTSFDVRSYLVSAYRRLGREQEARSTYEQLRGDYERGRARSYDMAVAAAALGDITGGLRAIQRVLQEKDMLVTEVSLPCDPIFDPLKSDGRFAQLLASAGMKACPPATDARAVRH